MKIRLSTLMGATAAILLSALAAQAQTALKWAHVYETSEPFHTDSVWAAEEIAKRTDGRYKIDVFPASQLGKEADINQGLKIGTVDIIISGSSFAARDFKPIGVTYFPYIFRDPSHLIAYTKSDIFKRLAKSYEDKTGNHIAAVSYYGTRHTTSNKPIATCADMGGLKGRVMGAGPAVNYGSRIGTHAMAVGARYYREFNAKNHFHGDVVMLSTTIGL